MKKYFVYDIDGCAYYDSIFITNKPLKKGYRYFIAECDSAHEANKAASFYLYESQKEIDLRYDREYYGGGDGYPPYDDFEDFIEFIEE